MKTIKTLGEIRNTNGKIYVRWSKSVNLDSKRGYSLRCGTQAESGLSCCEIGKDWADWRILRQLQEYQFVSGACWIITGDECGTGADNEPLLTNVKLIGKVADELISADYLLMWRNKMLAENIAKLETVTNEIAREIIAKSIAKLQSDDRRIWQRIMYSGA